VILVKLGNGAVINEKVPIMSEQPLVTSEYERQFVANAKAETGHSVDEWTSSASQR
jgi:hypothetical protein